MTAVWYGPAVHAIVEPPRIQKAEGIVTTMHDRSGPHDSCSGTWPSPSGTAPGVDLGCPGEGMVIQVPIGQATAPPEQVPRAARRHRIDLIVIGTHGRTARSEVWLGSVAARGIRVAPGPVLTVRGH
jgi:hypothetical protein